MGNMAFTAKETFSTRSPPKLTDFKKYILSLIAGFVHKKIYPSKKTEAGDNSVDKIREKPSNQ